MLSLQVIFFSLLLMFEPKILEEYLHCYFAFSLFIHADLTALLSALLQPACNFNTNVSMIILRDINPTSNNIFLHATLPEKVLH